MLASLLFIALALAGLSLAVRLYMGRAAEDALRPGEEIAIKQLRDPLPQNAFLACPPGYCAATAAASPLFAMTLERLAGATRRMLTSEPNAVMLEASPERGRFTLIQHTPLLRFPDIVTIELVSVAPGRSSLAIYSRSRYGRGDLGTNRRRVLRWLRQIEDAAAQ
jgi:uncharacterized protein (DUF1499 family)